MSQSRPTGFGSSSRPGACHWLCSRPFERGVVARMDRAPSPSSGGSGWGWVGFDGARVYPIPLPASPLKGEENEIASPPEPSVSHPTSPLKGEVEKSLPFKGRVGCLRLLMTCALREKSLPLKGRVGWGWAVAAGRAGRRNCGAKHLIPHLASPLKGEENGRAP